MRSRHQGVGASLGLLGRTDTGRVIPSVVSEAVMLLALCPRVSIVSGNGVVKQYVVDLWPPPNIVHDQGSFAIGGHLVDNNTNMGQVAGKHPGDQIAR